MVRLACLALSGLLLAAGATDAQHRRDATAVCVLRAPGSTDAKGEVWFCNGDGGASVTVVLEGLEPEALFEATLHQLGDMAAADGSTFGGVFKAGEQQTGALGPIRVQGDGRAREGYGMFGVTVQDVLGRGITLRAKRGKTPLLLGVVGLAVDTTPPTLTLARPPEVSDGVALVVCYAADDRALGRVHCEGQEATRRAVRGKVEFAFRLPTRAGANSVEVRAHDGACNVTSLQVSWAQDDSPPVITILAPRAGSQLNGNPVNVVATVVDENLASVTIGGEAATQDAKGRWRRAIQAKHGANTVPVTATDTLGNTATVNATFAYDGTPPGIKAEAVIVVEGKVDDLKASLTVNGVPVEFNRTTGRYTAKVKADPQDPGRVTVVATDEHGNRTTEVRRLR